MPALHEDHLAGGLEDHGPAEPVDVEAAGDVHVPDAEGDEIESRFHDDDGRSAESARLERIGPAYVEIPLTGPFSCWWQFTAGAGDRTGRILPDNSADLIVADDGRSWCVGPAQRVDLAPVAAGTGLRGLRLRPGHVGAVLGVPAHEATDREVALDDVFGTSVARRLTTAVWSGAGACTPGLLAARTPRTRQLVGALLASQPVTSTELAQQHGLSDRHLRRLVLDDAGLPPKTLQRVARLHRFLAATELRGLGLAAAAAAAGYADQPHLSRDVRELSGLPPAALLRERAAGAGA